MAKRRTKIHFRLPPYRHPRNEWRKLIYKAAKIVVESERVAYRADDFLEISITLYLAGRAYELHDLDNRGKDVLDALQGRMGGGKSIRKFRELVPNDRQFVKLCVTKALPPKQSQGFGHVTVRRFRDKTDARKLPGSILRGRE